MKPKGKREPMPRVRLTDAYVRTAKPRGGKLTEHHDTIERGLVLRVSPNGVKSWSCRFTVNGGKQKRIALGKLDNISLTRARALVVQHRAAIAEGADPSAEKKLARFEAEKALERETVSQIAAFYFERCAIGDHLQSAVRKPKRESTITNERYLFNATIIPQLGDCLLRDLSRDHIQSVIDGVAKDRSKSMAQKARAVFHGLCTFAQRRSYIDTNPCQFVSVEALPSRKRVLTSDELQRLWNALRLPISIDGAAVSAQIALALKLCMVTLQRRGEVATMHVADLDMSNRIWLIPDHRTKNKRQHIVPLSDMALELIDTAQSISSMESGFLFPSPVHKSQPVQPNAMSRAFARLRPALGIDGATVHDLRRTGATNLTGEMLGFPRFAVSKVLNHSGDTGGAAAVTGVYDRNEYLPEKRRALDAWAMRLQEIVAGESTSSNVVRLSKPALGG